MKKKQIDLNIKYEADGKDELTIFGGFEIIRSVMKNLMYFQL
jgi:hypothetical protein